MADHTQAESIELNADIPSSRALFPAVLGPPGHSVATQGTSAAISSLGLHPVGSVQVKAVAKAMALVLCQHIPGWSGDQTDDDL